MRIFIISLILAVEAQYNFFNFSEHASLQGLLIVVSLIIGSCIAILQDIKDLTNEN